MISDLIEPAPFSAPAPPPRLSLAGAAAAQAPGWPALERDYIAFTHIQDPVRAGARGDRAALERWPDDSPAALAAQKTALLGFKARLAAIPPSSLSEEDRLSRAVMARRVELSLESLDLDEARLAVPVRPGLLHHARRNGHGHDARERGGRAGLAEAAGRHPGLFRDRDGQPAARDRHRLHPARPGDAERDQGGGGRRRRPTRKEPAAPALRHPARHRPRGPPRRPAGPGGGDRPHPDPPGAGDSSPPSCATATCPMRGRSSGCRAFRAGRATTPSSCGGRPRPT